jgi:predicted ATPase/tetratricopeptide (TPR) repeat protein
MHCPSCGQANEKGGSFCSTCGAALPKPVGAEISPVFSNRRLPHHADDADKAVDYASFIGRERETSELLAAWKDAVARHGKLVLLAGDPGIGKTRLADEFAGRVASSEGRAIWGRCWEDGGAPPYWPWIEILRELIRDCDSPRLAELIETRAPFFSQLLAGSRSISRTSESAVALPLSADEARFRLFDSVCLFLREAATAQPLMLILDDMHAADAPSLLLLHFLARQLVSARVLLVATYRDAEVRRSPDASQFLGELSREGCLIPLRGLKEEEVGRFIESISGVAVSSKLRSAIYRATGGNPLFLDGTVRVLLADGNLMHAERQGLASLGIPEGVRQVVRGWLGTLSEPTNSILMIASVIGPEFDLEVLRSISGFPPAELLEVLEEACYAGVVRETPARFRYRFCHDLIREALYNAIPPAERAFQHRRVAEEFEQLTSEHAGSRLAELAHHYLRYAELGQGDDEKAVDYAIRAGQQATENFAWEEAVRLFQAALHMKRFRNPATRHQQCELLLKLGWAQGMLGATSDSNESIKRAAELARSLGASELLARAALSYRAAWWYPAYGRVDKFLIGLLEEALEAVGDRDSQLRAAMLSHLASELVYSPAARERPEQLSQRAVELARRVGEPAGLIYALWARCFVLAGSRNLDERVAVASELISLGEKTANRIVEMIARDWRAIAFFERGDIISMDADLGEWLAISSSLHRPRSRWTAAYVRAGRALFDGRFEEAERYAHEALQAGQETEPLPTARHVFLLQMNLLRSEQGRLLEVIDSSRALAQERPGLPLIESELAWVCAELDLAAEARIAFERVAAKGFVDLSKDVGWLLTVGLLCEVCAYVNDAERAALLYDVFGPYATHNVTDLDVLSLGSASRHLGLLAMTMERWRDAEAHFEEAFRLNLKMGSRPWAAHTQYDYAEMLVRRSAPGDAARALKLLEQALETARAVGMKRLAEKASELRSLAKKLMADESKPSTEPPSEEQRTDNEAPASLRADNTFRREGEYWTLAYQGHMSRVKHVQGLSYIAFLLWHPDQEFSAIDLVRQVCDSPASSSSNGMGDQAVPMRDEQLKKLGLHKITADDAGEMLDDKARASYRRRLTELQVQLDDAKRRNDVDLGEKLENEMDFLRSELMRAVGLRGRMRRANSASERARLTATRAIRRAIRKIAEHNSTLAGFLLRSIKTGTFCAYKPEAAVSWTL